MKLKLNYPRSVWIKLIVLSLIFCVHLCVTPYGVIYVGWFWSPLLTLGLFALIYLLLLIASACLIDSPKVWVRTLPIGLAICLIIPLLAERIFYQIIVCGGVAALSFMIPVWLKLPAELHWLCCIIFALVEVVAIQALGMGIRLLIGKVKKKVHRREEPVLINDDK